MWWYSGYSAHRGLSDLWYELLQFSSKLCAWVVLQIFDCLRRFVAEALREKKKRNNCPTHKWHLVLVKSLRVVRSQTAGTESHDPADTLMIKPIRVYGLEVVNGLISAFRAEKRDTNKKWRSALKPRLEGGDTELLKSHWYHTNSYPTLSFMLKGKHAHF